MSSIISQSELNSIIGDIREIINDDIISTDISFMLSGSTVSAWSPTTQLIPAMYATSSVSAFKGSYKLDEVEKSGGLIEFSDVKFIIMRDDVSGILSTIDKIYETGTNFQSATTYELKAIDKDPLNICYFIRARAV